MFTPNRSEAMSGKTTWSAGGAWDRRRRVHDATGGARLRWRMGIAACLIIGSTLFKASEAQSALSREYQIKAAFLYNFAQFVEWPAKAFPGTDSSLTICVLGDDPFGGALKATVDGEKVAARTLVVRQAAEVSDLEGCQIAFISHSEAAELAQILADLGTRAMLTVSEIEGFAADGGIINFYLDGNKVRFEINPEAARNSGIKLSAQLLSLGRIVEPSSTGSGSAP